MRVFSRVALLLCVVVYAVGMAVLIVLARQSPLRVIIEVRYPLAVYVLIVATCLSCMVLFTHRVGKRRS